MDVTVVVGTYGHSSWADLAQSRAVPSVPAGVPVLHTHGTGLADARNRGLDAVRTGWVCHLDADDELEAGYLEAVAAASADLRAPAVRYVTRGRAAHPRVPRVSGHRHECAAGCLAAGNWLVVGTVAPTSLLRQVGGWRDYTWSEDWDLWVRCWQQGATVEAVPAAVYRAHVRADSRNRAPTAAAKLAAHQTIARANNLPVPP